MRFFASSRIQRPYQRTSSARPCAPLAFQAPPFASFLRASGLTGGRPANFGGNSTSALLIITATGLRSEP
jgi:hypothetical protein